jgi:hypothetical protein
MKKTIYSVSFLSLLLIMMFSHCSEEESVPKIDFQTQTSSATEGVGTSIAFSTTLPNGVTPELSITGTATATTDYTYTITSNGISFSLKEDEVYDPGETIIVTLTGFDGNAEAGTKSVHTLTINDKDENADPGLLIDLSWNAGSGGPGDVDMDLFLWIESPAGSEIFSVIDVSLTIGTDFEQIFLPSNDPDYANGVYGLSYTYYEGTSDNLTFTADFKCFKGNIDGTGTTASFSEVYTLANVNAWDISEELFIAQIFEKSGQNYGNFSSILVPESGSRWKKLQVKLKEAVMLKRGVSK